MSSRILQQYVARMSMFLRSGIDERISQAGQNS